MRFAHPWVRYLAIVLLAFVGLWCAWSGAALFRRELDSAVRYRCYESEMAPEAGPDENEHEVCARGKSTTAGEYIEYGSTFVFAAALFLGYRGLEAVHARWFDRHKAVAGDSLSDLGV